LVLCLPPLHTAWAGAWPQEPGQWQAIEQFTYYQAAVQGTGPHGEPVGIGTYHQMEFAPYVEYGLTDRWTLGTQPRLQSVWTESAGATKWSDGLAQLNVFARYTVYHGDYDVVAVQGQVGVPGAATSADPQVAYPNTEYELRGLYGHGFSLGSWTGFTDAEVAGRLRMGADADEVRLDLTAGVRPVPDWMLLVQSFSTIGLRDNGPGGADYSITKLYASLVYDITPRVSVQVGGYRELAGRNVSLGNAGLLALWLKF
jgi:hypothetical protein